MARDWVQISFMAAYLRKGPIASRLAPMATNKWSSTLLTGSAQRSSIDACVKRKKHANTPSGLAGPCRRPTGLASEKRTYIPTHPHVGTPLPACWGAPGRGSCAQASASMTIAPESCGRVGRCRCQSEEEEEDAPGALSRPPPPPWWNTGKGILQPIGVPRWESKGPASQAVEGDGRGPRR